MAMPHMAPEQRWKLLATMPELRRIEIMMAEFVELAGVSEDERQTRLHAMILAESDLSEDRLFDMTKARLRAWTRMDQRAAHTVAQSYYPVLQTMGAGIQERFKSVEERVFDSLPWEQKRLSLRFIPNDEGYVPDLVESIEPVDEAEVPGGNAASREEMEERVLTSWERFRAWVTALTRAA